MVQSRHLEILAVFANPESKMRVRVLPFAMHRNFYFNSHSHYSSDVSFVGTGLPHSVLEISLLRIAK